LLFLPNSVPLLHIGGNKLFHYHLLVARSKRPDKPCLPGSFLHRGKGRRTATCGSSFWHPPHLTQQVIQETSRAVIRWMMRLPGPFIISSANPFSVGCVCLQSWAQDPTNESPLTIPRLFQLIMFDFCKRCWTGQSLFRTPG
jgi:hypothetical protein